MTTIFSATDLVPNEIFSMFVYSTRNELSLSLFSKSVTELRLLIYRRELRNLMRENTE